VFALIKYFLILLFFCSGCSLFSVKNLENDKGFHLASEKEKASIITAIKNSSSGLQTARVRSLLKLESLIFKTAFTFSAVASLPSKYRIELFTPGFPKLISLLVVNNQVASIYDAKKGKTFVAIDSSKLISDSLSVPLSASELFFLSIAKIDFNAMNRSSLNDNQFKFLVDPDFSSNGLFSLRTFDGKSFYGKVLDCDRPNIRLLRTEYANDDDVFLKAGFFHEQDQCSFVPESIRFNLVQEGLSGEFLNINYVENPDLSANSEMLFRLPE